MTFRLYSPGSCVGLIAAAWLGLGASHGGARLLAIMPMAESFRQTLSGMESDLGGDYELRSFDADTRSAPAALLERCRAFRPEGLVLMDAKAIRLAKDLQKRDTAFARLPKFVLMTLKAEDAVQGLDNVAGIRFEVPAYTIFTNLRILSAKDFRKVGVFHRKGFSEWIEESRRFLAKENIELASLCLDCGRDSALSPGETTRAMKAGMQEFLDRKVEVAWMLADNALVNETTLKGFWLPRFRRGAVPLVVPLANLAGLDLDMGLFAAYPDYFQLGVQSAQQIIQVFESGIPVGDIGLESLISIQTTFNEEVSRRTGWGLRPGSAHRVNTILRKK